MAHKSEEYGSYDEKFDITDSGTVMVWYKEC